LILGVELAVHSANEVTHQTGKSKNLFSSVANSQWLIEKATHFFTVAGGWWGSRQLFLNKELPKASEDVQRKPNADLDHSK
jgi:hypothetical protein